MGAYTDISLRCIPSPFHYTTNVSHAYVSKIFQEYYVLPKFIFAYSYVISTSLIISTSCYIIGYTLPWEILLITVLVLCVNYARIMPVLKNYASFFLNYARRKYARKANF